MFCIKMEHTFYWPTEGFSNYKNIVIKIRERCSSWPYLITVFYQRNEDGWYINECFTLGIHSKNKRSLCTVSLWELFRKQYFYSGLDRNFLASSPGKKQIRPHHFCHTGPFVTYGGGSTDLVHDSVTSPLQRDIRWVGSPVFTPTAAYQ